MTGAFGRDHDNVHVGGRHDLAVMDIKAVCKHERVSFHETVSNTVGIEHGLLFVVDEDHDYVCKLRRIFCSVYLQASFFCRFPGFAALIEADDDVYAALFEVQRVRVTLAAVADNGDDLVLQVREVAVAFIIHLCHLFHPPNIIKNLLRRSPWNSIALINLP